MPSQRSAPIEDDVFVTREVIMALFDPPLRPSTFHNRANKGDFVLCRGLRGYYALNATRRKLGLPLVDIHAYRTTQQELTEAQKTRQRSFLALTLVVPDAFRVFASEDIPGSLTADEVNDTLELVADYEQALSTAELTDPVDRLEFVGEALKALSCVDGSMAQ